MKSNLPTTSPPLFLHSILLFYIILMEKQHINVGKITCVYYFAGLDINFC